jgi:hypothetical protein
LRGKVRRESAFLRMQIRWISSTGGFPCPGSYSAGAGNASVRL